MNITIDDFLLFCDRTIDGMATKISDLSDEQVVQRPDVPGANSPYAIVSHALGACGWWTAHAICGHASDRDRAGEFHAAGTTAALLQSCHRAKAALRALQPELEAATELAHEVQTETPLPQPWTVGSALMHAYEELAQHCGHLDVTVDLITSADARSSI